jgi:signal peptidase II
VSRTARQLLLLAVVVFVFDQATKLWIVEGLGLAHRLRIEVWPGFVTFIMAWNRGINFGVLASDLPMMRWGLALLSVAISVGVGIWAVRRSERWFTLGAGLLIGGALGNGVDRVRYGAVADFLNVTCCGVVNPYAFNVADIAIFAGAAVLAFAPTPQTGVADGR